MTQISPAQVPNVLQNHIGQRNGIHVRELVQRITGQLANPAAQERRVRTIVAELRMQGEHVCGHPTSGYYMAATAEELTATCSFLYAR